MAGEYIEFDNNNQPAVNDANLNRMQQLIKQDIQGAVSGDTLPIGAILPFGSDTIPTNWLLCDGSAVSRTDYQDLFNIIGITYGQGDGFSTFNLPDFRDRVPVGKDTNDTDFSTLGNTGGEKEHTLTIEEMPSHNHTGKIKTGYTGVTSDGYTPQAGYSASRDSSAGIIQYEGGDQPHNIMQPYLITNYIIKAYQSAGVVANIIDNLNSTSAVDALSANQGKKIKELLAGDTLYSNSSGTTGAITLSKNISNFTRYKVYGYYVHSSTLTKFCKEFEVSNNIRVDFGGVAYDGGSFTYFQSEIATVDGTTLTRGTQYEIGLTGTSGYSTTRTSGTYIYITKIVGYEY